MNKRALLIILVSVVLVSAAVLAFQVIKTESAPDTSAVDAATEERLSGSDNILLHPPVPLPDNYYTGSDWIERHPDDYYAGSDWIERHPSQPTP